MNTNKQWKLKINDAGQYVGEKPVTGEGNAPREIISSGQCFGENRHWHSHGTGSFSYHSGVSCEACRKYVLLKPDVS
jgi:hypothetical protein